MKQLPDPAGPARAMSAAPDPSMTLADTTLSELSQKFSSSWGKMAMPLVALFTTRFLVTVISLPPAMRMPLPYADQAAFRPGAPSMPWSWTRLPAMVSRSTGGSSSESRVLGTMPAMLLRHSEFTSHRSPEALVPE